MDNDAIVGFGYGTVALNPKLIGEKNNISECIFVRYNASFARFLSDSSYTHDFDRMHRQSPVENLPLIGPGEDPVSMIDEEEAEQEQDRAEANVLGAGHQPAGERDGHDGDVDAGLDGVAPIERDDDIEQTDIEEKLEDVGNANTERQRATA